jgi:hypothetical protein
MKRAKKEKQLKHYCGTTDYPQKLGVASVHHL